MCNATKILYVLAQLHLTRFAALAELFILIWLVHSKEWLPMPSPATVGSMVVISVTAQCSVLLMSLILCRELVVECVNNCSAIDVMAWLMIQLETPNSVFNICQMLFSVSVPSYCAQVISWQINFFLYSGANFICARRVGSVVKPSNSWLSYYAGNRATCNSLKQGVQSHFIWCTKAVRHFGNDKVIPVSSGDKCSMCDYRVSG